jgi:hypothetical protein
MRGMPQKPELGREVFAHFSTPSLVIAWLGWLGMLIAGCYFLWGEIVSGPDSASRDMMGNSPDRIMYVVRVGMLVTLCTGLASGLPRMFRLTRGAISARAAALWVENGRLTFADKVLLDVPLTDTVSVEQVREPIYGLSIFPYHVNWIVVQLKNGKKAKLPPTYVENTDDVVAALSRRLGPGGAG